MPDYENIARTAGWISAPCYNGETRYGSQS